MDEPVESSNLSGRPIAQDVIDNGSNEDDEQFVEDAAGARPSASANTMTSRPQKRKQVDGEEMDADARRLSRAQKIADMSIEELRVQLQAREEEAAKWKLISKILDLEASARQQQSQPGVAETRPVDPPANSGRGHKRKSSDVSIFPWKHANLAVPPRLDSSNYEAVNSFILAWFIYWDTAYVDLTIEAHAVRAIRVMATWLDNDAQKAYIRAIRNGPFKTWHQFELFLTNVVQALSREDGRGVNTPR